MPSPTVAQLKQAITIAEQIDKLKAELTNLLGGSSSFSSVTEAVAMATQRVKRKMSAATIAKMKASQQARWAKAKGAISDVVESVSKLIKPTKGKKANKAPKKQHKLSPEGRAKIAAAQKARWAGKRKAEK